MPNGLKAVVADLEDVQEGLREFYAKGEDGQHYLQAEGIRDHPEVGALTRAHERQKEEAKEAKERLAKFEGVDPDEYAAAKAKLAEIEEAQAKKAGDFDALKKGLEERHQKTLAEKDAAIEKQRAFIDRLVVENELQAAVAAVDVRKEVRDGALALLKSMGPKVMEDGGEFRGVFESEGGAAVPIRDFVTEWAKKDENAGYIAPSGTNGTGAKGSGGGAGGAGDNPWSRESLNLTRQAQITRDDPAKAERLKAAAGVQ